MTLQLVCSCKAVITFVVLVRTTGRQILVAVDRSETALRALAWALHELYRSGDTIHVVRAPIACLLGFKL